MSTSSDVCLGAIRLASQEAGDNEQNPAVSTEAWNQFITNSYKLLYNMLVGAYGNDYYVATSYQFTTTNAQLYALPDGTPNFLNSSNTQAAKFYKLLGVDIQNNASLTGWADLKNLNFIDRNRGGYSNSPASWYAYTNLRYRVQGNNLFFSPLPQAGQQIKIWYVPPPTNLQYRLPGSSVSASNRSE